MSLGRSKSFYVKGKTRNPTISRNEGSRIDNTDGLRKTQSVPITRQRSGSLVHRPYHIGPIKLGRNKETIHIFLKRYDGKVAKLVRSKRIRKKKNSVCSPEFDMYDPYVAMEVLQRKRGDLLVEWVYFDI